MDLSKKEAISYVGGAKISLGIITTIIAIGSFIMGFIDGITNPQKCNNR